jgi:hypothetical protein
MPNFKKFVDAVNTNFAKLTDCATQLYVADVSGDDLWETYLSSFPSGTNEVYKVRAENDCSACKHFVRHYGNVVVVVNDQLVSFWDLPNLPHPFDIVANKLATRVKSAKISNVFVCNMKNLGTTLNNVLDKTNGKITTFNHLHSTLPVKHIYTKKDSIEAVQGEARAHKEVFARSLNELTIDAAETILELIEQNSIYRGQEFKAQIAEFVKLKKEYLAVPDLNKDCWLWTKSINNFVSKIRNTAIGTLLIDVSKGEELDNSVAKFEKIMAPTNYKRPQAIITQKMIKEAEATIVELGFAESLARRHAVAADISVENVLFVNRSLRGKLKGGLLDVLTPTAQSAPKNFDKITEVSAEEFLSNVLPTASAVEVMVENSHTGNFMSIVAPENKNAPSMLKWDNNFSWAYNGDIADSMRQEVKSRGGNIDGPFRFTHSWNHDGQNQSLMDLHVFMPGNSHHNETIKDHPRFTNLERVGWDHRSHPKSGGVQDVDHTAPPGKTVPIENISFPAIKRMPEGIYICKVHNWAARNPNISGFKAEIELNGELYQYEYPTHLKNHEWVTVAHVTLKDGQFTIDHKIKPASIMSKEIWGVKTNDFTPVSMVTISPNYWGERKVGNKHVFFILDKCKNTVAPRGFFNEYLKDDLTKHKRVFEALGSKMRVADSDDQLSGVGFSLTQNNSVVVRVEGKTKRIVKVLF